jgi:hypothetical protein
MKLFRRVATAAALLWAGCAAAVAQDAERTVPYVVKKGDTVQQVSGTLLDEPSDYLEVARFNQLRNPNRIYPGQRLLIPVRLLRGTPAPLTLTAAHGPVQIDGKPAKAGDAVAEGASVTTGDKGSAVLTRRDGSAATLLPNSLAQVQKNRALQADDSLLRTVLKLGSGAVDLVVEKLSLKDHVKVTTPTSTIGVRGTQYRVAAEDQSRSRVEVLQGQVLTQSPVKRTDGVAVNGGFGTVVLQGSPPIEPVKLLPAPVLPQTALAVRMVGEPIAFSTVDGARAYRYIISPAGVSAAVTASGTVSTAGFALPELANGDYELRLRSVDSNGLEGLDATRKLQVLLANAPFNLASRDTADGLLLTWQTSRPQPRYRVQLQTIKDPSFTQVAAEADLTEAQAALRDLEPGTYYWRVGQPNAQGGWVYSEPAVLTKR